MSSVQYAEYLLIFAPENSNATFSTEIFQNNLLKHKNTTT